MNKLHWKSEESSMLEAILVSKFQACCVKVGPGNMLQLSQQLFAHS